MKTTGHLDQIAFGTEKELPVAVTPSLPRRSAPASSEVRPHGHIPGVESSSWSAWQPTARTEFNGVAADALRDTSLSVPQWLTLEISKHAVELREYRAGSLAVVLKPDGDTEVFLHLSQRDGLIEIQARFEKGDYQGLNGGWDQLQRQLHPLGIRLGNLEQGHTHGAAQHFTAGHQGQSDSSRGHDRKEPRSPKSLDELPLVGSITESPRRSRQRATALRQRLLESWA